MAQKPTVDECLRFIGHGFDFFGHIEGGYVYNRIQSISMLPIKAFLIIEDPEDEQAANKAIGDLIKNTSDALGIADLLTGSRSRLLGWGGEIATSLVFIYNASTRNVTVATLETALKLAGGKKLTVASLMNDMPNMHRGVAGVHTVNARDYRRRAAGINTSTQRGSNRAWRLEQRASNAEQSARDRWNRYTDDNRWWNRLSNRRNR
jgi:hypothetical protein